MMAQKNRDASCMREKLVSESRHDRSKHCDDGVVGQSGEERDHPLVLACAYTRIVQSKAGNQFPAWHVFCPLLEEDANKVDGGGTTSCGLQWQTCWRSKRDFLRLGRAMAQARGHFQDGPRYTPFPKAAFQKLSLRAPWHRPLLDKSWEASSDIRGNQKSSGDPSKEANNFDVSMKKSLWQMDQFLQCAYYFYSCIHRKQNADSRGKRENQTDDDTFLQMKRAWEDFCQPVDSSDVFNPSQQAPLPTGRLQVQRSPQSLGQYFCTSENAEKLVNLLWNKVLQAHAEVDSGNQLLPRDFVILEPSCGHGQIIWTLLEKPFPSVVWKSYKSTAILGMDIDSCAIQKCTDDPRVTALSAAKTRHDGNNVLLDVGFVCHDFLSSKRSDYCSENCTVVAIGGPPYGTNPKDRDLPLQFVKHCIQEWKAQVVAFLVPERFSQHDPVIDYSNVHSHEMGAMDAYSVECQTLLDSTFYYRGDTPFKQPSRIQCWYRESSFENLDVGACG